MPFDTPQFAHDLVNLRVLGAGAANPAREQPHDKPLRAPGRRVFLPRRNTLVLDNREGTVITMESGTLWVTLERDPRDIILVPGMRFEIDRTGRTVVAAEEDSRFRLRSAETLRDRAIAWATHLAIRTRARWAHRLARLGVPYY